MNNVAKNAGPLGLCELSPKTAPTMYGITMMPFANACIVPSIPDGRNSVDTLFYKSVKPHTLEPSLQCTSECAQYVHWASATQASRT